MGMIKLRSNLDAGRNLEESLNEFEMSFTTPEIASFCTVIKSLQTTGHVEEGIRLTSAAGIPSILQDFIRTHHGKGLARYFYTTYKNEHQDEEIDETPFR